MSAFTQAQERRLREIIRGELDAQMRERPGMVLHQPLSGGPAVYLKGYARIGDGEPEGILPLSNDGDGLLTVQHIPLSSRGRVLSKRVRQPND